MLSGIQELRLASNGIEACLESCRMFPLSSIYQVKPGKSAPAWKNKAWACAENSAS